MQQTSGGYNIVTTTTTNVTTLATMSSYVQPIMSTLRSPIMSTTGLGLTSPRPQIDTSIYQTLQTPTHSPSVGTSPGGLPWQLVKTKQASKRGRERETDISNKRTNIKNTNDNLNTSPTYNTNIFTCLNDEPVESQKNREPKPPPVFIQDVINFPLMLETLRTVLDSKEYICKTLANNEVKVNTHSSDGYRKLIHLLDVNKTAYHTYQPKQERAYRTVIKNLHHSVPAKDVKEALEEKGFVIRNVINIKSWLSKAPLPMFFVDQEPGEGNKNIYEIDHLLGTKIKVEAPRKKKELPQCMRCQEYGHTKTYCRKPFYCVKCAENHPTSECKKDKNTPAVCVLCSGSHPANYKGCRVYNDIQKQRNKPLQTQPKTTNHSRYQTRENVSYSNATKNNTNTIENSQQNHKETNYLDIFLNKFESMFNQLMQQNNMIINLLTTLVSKK